MTDATVYQLGGYAVANPYPNILLNQYGVYALGSQPAEFIYASHIPNVLLGAAETSSGLYKVFTHQLGAYALVRGLGDRRDLRAWTFTQDDHDFYVLQLGSEGTLIHDKLTNQWAQWKSPDFLYWRGNDGQAWEGMNLCCDTETGILWEIDPIGRLDTGDTPITTKIVGKTTERMRANAPCFMAELTVSEGSPPTGIDASTLTITLRTSDNDEGSYISHGSIPGTAIGEDITVRWYGLGVIPAPGRVFEIVDTGYARRIDGLTIEVGGVGG